MKKNTKQTLKIYLKFSAQHKWLGLLAFGAIVLATLVFVASILPVKNLFDIISSAKAPVEVFDSLIKILLLLLALRLISWALWRVATFSITYFEAKIMANLENFCFEYLHKHSFNFFQNNFVGSLVKKVKWFSRSFEVITDQIFWALTSLAVNIIAVSFILFYRNFWLGIAVVLWTIIFLTINIFFSRYKLKYDIKKAKQETKTTAILADTVSCSRDIKFFNGSQREAKGFAKAISQLKQMRIFAWNLGNYFEALQGLLMIGLEIGIFYLAIVLWKKGIITVGDFALVQLYLINLFQRVWDFGKVLRRIYESLADAAEMTEILETPLEITDVINAKPLVIATPTIEFKKVDFCYQQTRKVLDGFNLIISAGEKIALVGPSGAGKTTVVKLLLRMVDVTDGEILVSSQNIAKVKQNSLRESIALVPQEPTLFHRTLFENIRYGKPKATKKQVIEAAKKAHCHEFISKFPLGYQTYVGERGVKLSAGERQRVAIARALLKDSPILVLDEATSSLDSESEKLIQEAMQFLMQNKTVIAIAHRLSTITQMDRIIVISDGNIIEQGKHNELLKTPNSLYGSLWRLQAGGFIPT